VTFTWDTATLTTSALQQVRATIGDIDSGKPLLTDEQINWRLGQYSSSVTPAAIACVRDIIAKLARDVDRSNVGFSSTRSQQITHFKDLLTQLQADNMTLAEVSLGGVSDSAEEALNSDSDYRQFPI
jgi:hypothetical protein